LDEEGRIGDQKDVKGGEREFWRGTFIDKKMEKRQFRDKRTKYRRRGHSGSKRVT
jgi:hypothetical protein